MNDCANVNLTLECPLSGPPLVTRRWGEPQCDVTMAVWMPSAELMLQPGKLRHAPSTAIFFNRTKQIWVVSLLNDAVWSMELILKVDAFLVSRFETWSWSRLEVALADHLELPLVLHNPSLLADKILSILEIPRLVDAIFRRKISTESDLPVPLVLRQMKTQLTGQIESEAAAVMAEFLSLANPQTLAAMGQIGLPLDLYNYVVSQAPRPRLQFVSDFPLLAKVVSSADARSVFRKLRAAVDRRESPVRFLSQALKVSPSAVGALRGVQCTEVGRYFEAHLEELISLLDSLPPEHRPQAHSHSHWCIFLEQYTIAKNLFGRSPAGTILVRAQIGHALRYAVGMNRVPIPIIEEDVHRVERLFSGLIGSIFSQYGVCRNHSLDIQRRARISRYIDDYLGHLAWSRLVALASKWARCYAAAVEKNGDAISFISSDQYWDHIPDGKFVATNGWSMRCLRNAAELKAQGEELDICLATTGHRAAYHEECLKGAMAVVVIDDPNGLPSSTASFLLSVHRDAPGDSAVRFRLLQHTGFRNQNPAKADLDAMHALQNQFTTSAWQLHALQGVRFCLQRCAIKDRDKGTPAALLVAGLQAFRATLGDAKASAILSQFSEEVQ